MFTPREILFTTVVPAAIALLVLVASWRPWRRAVPVTRGHWGGPLAAGLAFVTSYGLLDAALATVLPAPDWLRAEVALVASAALVVCLFGSVLGADTWPAPSAA